MADVSVIQFTQDQARSMTGVSSETLRHWRKAVPYLAIKRGKAARFTFADLLALAVTNQLVNTFGVHIAALRNGVDAVFQLLARSDAARLEHATVFVTVTDATLFDAERQEAERMPIEPALMIPLAPLITAIQRQMLPIEPVSSQGILPFLPEAVRSRA